MSFSTDKAAALEVLNAYDCDKAKVVDRLLVGYSDMFSVFLYLVPTFECAPALMTSYLEAFDPAELEIQKIYFGQTGTDVTDAKIVANSTYDTVTFTIPAGDRLSERVIIGSSEVGKVIVDGGSGALYLSVLDVSAGAKVDVLEVDSAVLLQKLVVSGCNGTVSTVGVAKGGSNIVTVDAFNGGYFGGYNCLDPEAVCAVDVTSIAANKITSNSLLLNWTTPGESIRTIVNYRLSNTNSWLNVGVSNGDGVEGNYATDGSTGYAFRGLQMDTYYDFRVINVCNNGILSAGVQLSPKTNGVASSGGSGGGTTVIDGTIQFIATGGETETYDDLMLGAPSVEVSIEGAERYQSTDAGNPRYDEFVNFMSIEGKVYYHTPLTADQLIIIKVFR